MGWDDALICTSAGNVVESGAANLWWAEGARLYTPPLAAGCVGGVARAALLQLLPQKGYSVAEEETNSERLVSADTVFLSNALRGLRPVHTLGDVEYALPFIDVVPINAALYE